MKRTPFNAVRTTLQPLITTVTTYYGRVKMIPKAIADALTGAVTSSQALPGKVPTSGTVLLTAQDVTDIGGQLGNIQNAINATAAALDALNPPAPATTGSETPVGP